MGWSAFWFLLVSCIGCGKCQLYTGTGFPVAVQFKMILLPAESFSSSCSGLAKVGGSEDTDEIGIQTREREKDGEIKTQSEKAKTRPTSSVTVKLRWHYELTEYIRFMWLWLGRGNIWSCWPKVQLCLTPDLSSIIISMGHQIEDRWHIDWIYVGFVKCLCIENLLSLVPVHREVP